MNIAQGQREHSPVTKIAPEDKNLTVTKKKSYNNLIIHCKFQPLVF